LNQTIDPAGGNAVTATKQYTGSAHVGIRETVANGQTDKQINVAIDVSAVKSIIIKSTQDVTLETNSGSAADDTINLLANVPYIWNTDSYDAFLLGTDVTALFITNASGASADISVDAVLDATP
jgi:hypothetical protein